MLSYDSKFLTKEVMNIRHWNKLWLILVLSAFCLHGAAAAAWADNNPAPATGAGITIDHPDVDTGQAAGNPDEENIDPTGKIAPTENELIASLLTSSPHYQEMLLERYSRRIIALREKASSEGKVADLGAIATQSVRWVSLNLDLKDYTNVLPVSQPSDLLVVVNKFRKLSSAYVPGNLIKVAANYATRTGFLLRSDAYGQFKKMHADAARAGLKIRINSAYRSYAMQNGIYNDFAKRLGLASAKTRAALPGHSEHQTGLAVDLSGSHSSFAKSKEYKWLLANAHRYGFIRRYTAENAYITRYVDEPWHWRYVGVAAATAMRKQGTGSLEEYALRLVEEKYQLAASQAVATATTTNPASSAASNPSGDIPAPATEGTPEILSGAAIILLDNAQ